MSDTSNFSARDLVAFIAPPRSIKTMVHEVAEATGVHPRLIEGAWRGQQVSRRTLRRLREVAELQAYLATTIERADAPDRELADALRTSAGQFHSVADR